MTAAATEQKTEPESSLVQLVNLLGRYDMRAPYAQLLSLATSIQTLRHLHDKVLPEDCRLMREDVEALLEPAWKQVKGRDDETAQFLFDCARSLPSGKGKTSLHKYYVDKIYEVGRRDGIAYSRCRSVLHRSKPHSYEEGPRFYAMILDHLWGLRFQISDEEVLAYVYLRPRPDPNKWAWGLTELLTHRILTEFPSFFSDLSREIDERLYSVFYLFPTDGLDRHWDWVEGWYGPLERYHYRIPVVKDSFCREIARRLRALGLPIVGSVR